MEEFLTMHLYAAIGVGLLMAALLFKLFFADFADFVECLKYWFWGKWISFFQGELEEYSCDTFKLMIWILLSGLCGLSAYFQPLKWFPKLFA
jgi:hypothetical protein